MPKEISRLPQGPTALGAGVRIRASAPDCNPNPMLPMMPRGCLCLSLLPMGMTEDGQGFPTLPPVTFQGMARALSSDLSSQSGQMQGHLGRPYMQQAPSPEWVTPAGRCLPARIPRCLPGPYKWGTMCRPKVSTLRVIHGYGVIQLLHV